MNEDRLTASSSSSRRKIELPPAALTCVPGLSHAPCNTGSRDVVIVTMTSCTSEGEPKVVDRCTFPLTARAAVDTIVTELCVFHRRDGCLRLAELLGDATVDDVRAVTTARFALDDALAVRA